MHTPKPTTGGRYRVTDDGSLEPVDTPKPDTPELEDPEPKPKPARRPGRRPRKDDDKEA